MIAELLSGFITQFISSIGYAGVFVLMALESAALPVPSEVVMPFAGYLAYLGVFDIFLISLVGAIGCTAGSVASYYVGLKGGRKAVEKYGRYVLLDGSHLRYAEEWFARHGDKAVLVSRLLPVVRTVVSLPAGIAKYDLKKLVAFSFIGSLPWCLALAYAGYALGPFWKEIVGFFNGLDIAVVAAIIIAVLYFWKFRKRQH